MKRNQGERWELSGKSQTIDKTIDRKVRNGDTLVKKLSIHSYTLKIKNTDRIK